MSSPDRHLEYLHAYQASKWLETLEGAGPEQRSKFVAWLKESPRNVRDVLSMLTLDQALGQIDADRRKNIETLLAQAQQVVPLRPMETPARVPALRRGGIRVAIAAGVAVAALALWLMQTVSGDLGLGWKEFTTATGEQRIFELEDGSLVHLNTHSRLAVRFSGDQRIVRLLEGEALFKVRHEASRPFLVHAHDVIVEDQGTEFNVYDRPTGTVIAVLEGRVSITTQETAKPAAKSPARTLPSQERRSVSANEEARVSRAGVVSVRPLKDAAEVVAWQERRLIFREDTLERIVEEFNRYNHERIELDGSGIASRLYTGVFDADDPESFLQVLERDPMLSVEHATQRVIVRSR